VVRQPSYTIINSSLTWTSLDGRYDIRLWGKNLASAKYYAFATSQPFGEETSPAFPLTFGISAGVHLD
jgi:iron complex outermembrane receptor protein